MWVCNTVSPFVGKGKERSRIFQSYLLPCPPLRLCRDEKWLQLRKRHRGNLPLTVSPNLRPYIHCLCESDPHRHTGPPTVHSQVLFNHKEKVLFQLESSSLMLSHLHGYRVPQIIASWNLWRLEGRLPAWSSEAWMLKQVHHEMLKQVHHEVPTQPF